MTRAERRAGLVAAAALALSGMLAGCAGAAEPTGSPPAPSPSVSAPVAYVALGDSFTAAPFVPSTAFADGCLRSDGNYPAIVAEKLGARLRDVSCSGAATADLASPQEVSTGDWHGKVPPQLDAVRRGTDLVTVGIGGNDEDLFRTLVQECTSLAGRPGTPCADLITSYGDPDTVLAEVGRRMTTVLESVMRKAPRATVVLVGYPRLVDPARSCRAMPLAEGDLPMVVHLEEQLNRTLARAARTTGAEFVDLRGVSEGHEICSADPWVNGRTTDTERALAFHPFAAGQQAVAQQVLATLP